MKEKLALLTEEELKALYLEDKRKEERYNLEHDQEFNLDSFTRKWRRQLFDASYDWALINKLDNKQFLELIYWLSVKATPRNPKGGRPGLVKELARDIKYAMTSKQRAVAYSIITKRYNKVRK